MPERPRIGITTSFTENRQELGIQYVQAIERAGGLPLILPMLETASATEALVALLDGLLITGGPGITEGMVGTLPDDLAPVSPTRDASDRLVYRAFGTERPVLGICYGMQFINAQAGGTLYADVSAQRPNTALHSAGRGATEHSVQLAPGTHLHRVMDATTLITNTYHIQAVKEPGAGLHVNALSEDGVIEGLESDDGRLLGVQFHPERMDNVAALFVDFVNRCRS